MKYLCILLFLSTITIASAATGGVGIPGAIAKTVADTDTIVRKRSISVGLSYGSDALFFGRTGPITYPYMSADVIYNTKAGFFAYGSVLRLLGYRTSVDEIDVGGGYLYRPSKNFSGSLSYTRFIFNKEERIIESASAHDINFKNAYDWKFSKSTVIMDYLFGKASDFFLTINQSKYFETPFGIFDNKDYLSFNPGVSVIIGTQNFVQKYSTEHEDMLAPLSIYGYGSSLYPYRYNNGRFRALNYSFKIPVAYNRAHYTFEASYKYSIPVNVEGALKNKRESFFNLTFYYVFY